MNEQKQQIVKVGHEDLDNRYRILNNYEIKGRNKNMSKGS